MTVTESGPSAHTDADVRHWRGHVIVFGLHGVGLRTVEQLHGAGVRVIVVDADPDPRLVRVVRAWGVPYLSGAGGVAQSLRDAGLDRAAAVVCVERDDLRTLEVALLAREARADVRIVMQLANPAVGRAMAATGGPGAVLDIAALAAPSVVEACLRLSSHELDLDGERTLVVTTRAPRAATLRELYSGLTPLIVAQRQPQDGRPVAAQERPVSICPGRDLPVHAGDAVALLGTVGDLAAAGVSAAGHHRPGRRRDPAAPTEGPDWPDGTRPPRRRGAWAALVATLAGEVDRRMKIAVAVLVSLVCVSTTVLHLAFRAGGGRGMSWLDGLYFTVETIATVGYGDFAFRNQSPWLRLFAIGLMSGGAALAAVFFALLTNLLVSRRIEESLGRRHVPGLRGHTVVVGIGSVGVRVVEGLVAAGHDVVVVEQEAAGRYFGRLRDLGVPVVVGDATQRSTLEAANVAAAGAVAVLTSDDLTNLETGLAVRDLIGPDSEAPVVLRLFDRDLARTVEATFGFTHVRSTAALAAPFFVGAALGLDVIATFYVERVALLLARLTVPAGGGLDGTAMQDLGASLRVVAIRRASRAASLEYTPRRGARLAAGDVAYLVGPDEELIRLLRRADQHD